MFFLKFILNFWLQHPALLYGCSFLVGCYLFLQPTWALGIPLFALWFPLLWGILKKEFSFYPFLLSFLLVLAAFGYGTFYYQFPSLSEEGEQGMAFFELSHFKEYVTPFGRSWIYQGNIRSFFPSESKTSIAKNIPCTICFAQNESVKRPLAHTSYLIKGRLIQNSYSSSYVLKVKKTDAWEGVKNSWSLAEIRYTLKQKVRSFIHTHLPHSLSAAFLAGLFTGEFTETSFSFEFGRFGLQHLLAISGFHFAILAGLCHFLLRLCVSQKASAWVLMILLSLYVIFLGCQPSIIRAWCMIMVTFLGFYMEKEPSALNSLGIALLLLLLIDPLFSQTIGFQFSFLITGSILLLHAPFQAMLLLFLPKRPLSQLIEMNKWNQHAYCILTLFRHSLALGLAIHFVAFPLTLYYFQTFPWLSLIYNSFFPFLVSLSFLLLVLGSLLTLCHPFLAEGFHTVNSYYTKGILSLVYQLPTHYDHYFRIEAFSTETFIFSLTSLLIIALKIRHSFEKPAKEMFSPLFI